MHVHDLIPFQTTEFDTSPRHRQAVLWRGVPRRALALTCRIACAWHAAGGFHLCAVKAGRCIDAASNSA